MIIRLDPFHLIRAINCPEPGVPFVVRRAFQLEDYNPPGDGGANDITETLCTGGTKTINTGTHWTVGLTSLPYVFTAKLYSCAQMEMVVVGQTSGVRRPMRGLERAFLGFSACIDQNCWIATDTGMVLHRGRASGSLTIGDWEEYTTEEIGMVRGEWCDIELPAGPQLTITSVTDNAPGIVVTTVEDHGYDVSETIIIGETVLYDGPEEVQSVLSAKSFSVATTYLGNETAGIVQPDYQPVIF